MPWGKKFRKAEVTLLQLVASELMIEILSFFIEQRCPENRSNYILPFFWMDTLNINLTYKRI